VNVAETHETFHPESGMRYQLQITTSGGPLPITMLHVVVFTDPHDSEPLCGTNPRSPSTIGCWPARQVLEGRWADLELSAPMP
jgi:hypothetical protein